MKKSEEEKRKERNDELKARMKNPADNLTKFDAQDTWFQCRPKIKKNKNAFEMIKK